MSAASSLRLTLLGALALALIAGCDDGAPAWAPGGEAPAPAAVVNGVAIGGDELTQALAAAARGDNPHSGGAAVAPDRGRTLATLIDQELAAQQAVALGLDDDPAYRAEIGRLEAQLATVRRQRLAALFDREVAAQVPSDAAAVRAYYDLHAEAIRTRTRVWQMMFRDRARADAAAAELAAGGSFETVAARALGAADGATPWDVGFLAWNQLPDAWAPTLATLAAGATSGVIAGPGGRAWIIRVVARQPDPAQTFEQARPAIELRLGDLAARAARSRELAELRARARIELPRAP